MPVDINRLTEGWLELESDPGVFLIKGRNFCTSYNLNFSLFYIKRTWHARKSLILDDNNKEGSLILRLCLPTRECSFEKFV